MRLRDFIPFLRATQGSVAIEFATTGTAVLLLMLTLMEGAGMLMVQGMIDTAVNRAARFGMTGAGGDFAARQARIAAIVEQTTFGFLDPDKLAVHTLAYDDFNSISGFESFFDANGNGALDAGEDWDDRNGDGVHQADTNRLDPGGAGEVVVYQVTYKWQGFTPLISSTLGEIVLRTALPVRNEVY